MNEKREIININSDFTIILNFLTNIYFSKKEINKLGKDFLEKLNKTNTVELRNSIIVSDSDNSNNKSKNDVNNNSKNSLNDNKISQKNLDTIEYLMVLIFKNNDNDQNNNINNNNTNNNGYIELLLYVKENVTKIGSIKLNHNINIKNSNKTITYIDNQNIEPKQNNKILIKPFIINENDIHLYANNLILGETNTEQTKPTFTKPENYDKQISLFKFNKIRINFKGIYDKLSINQLYIFKYDFDSNTVINIMTRKYIKTIQISNGVSEGNAYRILDNNEFTTVKSNIFNFNMDGYVDIFFKDYHKIYDIVSFEFKNVIDYNSEQVNNKKRRGIFKLLGFSDNCCQSSFSNIVKNIEYYSNEIIKVNNSIENNVINAENTNNKNEDLNENSDYIFLHSFNININNNNSYHRIIYYNEQYTTDKYIEELGSKIDIYVKKIPYVELDREDSTYKLNEIDCSVNPNINKDIDLYPLCNNIFSLENEIKQIYNFDNKDKILNDYLSLPVIHDVNKLYKYTKFLKLKNVNTDFMILVKFIDLINVPKNENINLDILKINNESYFAKPINNITIFKDVCLLYKNGNDFYAYYLDINNSLRKDTVSNLDISLGNEYILYEDSKYYKIFFYMSKIEHQKWNNGISDDIIKKILCYHNEGCENIEDKEKPILTDTETLVLKAIDNEVDNISSDEIQNYNFTKIIDNIINKVYNNPNVKNVENYITPIIEKSIEKVVEVFPQVYNTNPDYLNVNVEELSSIKLNKLRDGLSIQTIINNTIQNTNIKLNINKIDKQTIDTIDMYPNNNLPTSSNENFTNFTLGTGTTGTGMNNNNFKSVSAYLYSNN
jgi:hypothetical protein